MRGVKGFKTEDIIDRATSYNAEKVSDIFNGFLEINKLLLEAERITDNAGVEGYYGHDYRDMSKRINRNWDDTEIINKVPEKLVERYEEIDDRLCKALQSAIEQLDVYSKDERTININGADRNFSLSMGSSREAITKSKALIYGIQGTSEIADKYLFNLEMSKRYVSDENARKQIDEQINAYIEKELSGLKHGEAFTCAYENLDYCTVEEREKIYLYWKEIDGIDNLLGIEMPGWWLEKKLKLPDGIEITESNIVDIYENADKETRELLKQYYFESYIIIDCISKYPLIDDIGSKYSDNNAALYSIDSYYADDMVDIWLDNMYGAMYDYVSGKESVRAVKYGLAKLYNYDGVYEDAGNYHTLTNDDSTLYEFFIENYMLKCGHIEHYYENYKDGAKADRERQLLEYLKQDIAVYELYLNKDKNELGIDADSKQLLLDSLNIDINKFILTDMELRMLDYERASDSYEKYGYIDFMNQYTLAYQLMHHMYGIGERDFEINENVIKITFSGGVDITSGKDFEEVSYTFVLDDNKAYGGYFIDIDQMLEISNAIVTKQLESGYMTGQKSDELERQAYQLLELYYTPEQLAFMEGDLLDETLKEAKKSILTTNLAVESFKGKHLRSIDAFNFGKDVAVTSLQLIVLAIAISNPGTTLAGAAYVANGGVGIADGAIRIDQGDTFNGAMEMSLSFLEVGSGLKLVSETTSLGKYVDEFIRDNRGCVGAKKAVEGGNASDLSTIKKGTQEWNDAVKNIANGGNTSYRTETATEAKELLNEARGNMNRYKQYTSTQYKKGFEMHPNEINTRNAPHNDLPHVKWKDWLGNNSGKGHIFFNKPN